MFNIAACYGFKIDDMMASAADVINFYRLETYLYRGVRPHNTHIKKYTDWAKYHGLEGKSNPIFSGSTDFGGLSPDIDFWIKYLRAESPQMAGLGVSIFKLYQLTVAERAVYDKVMDDNFFKLSPTVS